MSYQGGRVSRGSVILFCAALAVAGTGVVMLLTRTGPFGLGAAVIVAAAAILYLGSRLIGSAPGR